MATMALPAASTLGDCYENRTNSTSFLRGAIPRVRKKGVTQNPHPPKSEREYSYSSVVANTLLDKLSVIVGHCELMPEQAALDPEILKRLRLIQQVAQSMADDIHKYQGQIDAAIRDADAKAS